jgi:CO/xanthine dehydrogenase Mo-binding subunit
VLTHSARYSRYGDRTSGYLLATQLSGGKVDVPLVSEPGKIINNASIGGVRTVLYQVPVLRTLVHGLQTAEPHPLRPTELRSVSGLGGLFACESFLDELAASAGRDPLQYRLARLDNRRAIDVLEAVARLAGWEPRASPAPRRTDGGLMTGRGVALYGENTFVAVVAEVAVNGATGEVRVSRVHVAHDCGLIINPDGLKNQIEGNAVQAVSRSLMEAVNWDESRVTSLDWQSYPILRFPDVPDVQVTLISRPDSPAGGAGEATTYPMAGAVGNAVFDAIGVRLRQGPFTPEHVKAALSASA